MPHFPTFDNAPQPDKTDKPPNAGSLIRVPASEQLAPGAAGRCPVCGLDYTPGDGFLAEGQAAAPATTLEASAASPEPARPRMLLCPRCGTYSVGYPRPSPNSPAGNERPGD